MIRLDSATQESFIWFQLECDKVKKIEWPLSLFLLLSKENKNFFDFRKDVIESGVISMLSLEELELVKSLPASLEVLKTTDENVSIVNRTPARLRRRVFNY